MKGLTYPSLSDHSSKNQWNVSIENKLLGGGDIALFVHA